MKRTAIAILMGTVFCFGGIATAATLHSEDFETIPSWSSSFDAAWGSPATATILSGGQSGNYLQMAISVGSSARVLVYDVSTVDSVDISVYLRCQSGSGDSYWMQTSYKGGSNSAQDFDAGTGWAHIQKFDGFGGYPDGNGDMWTEYTASVDVSAYSEISIGVMAGTAGGGSPNMGWDSLVISGDPIPEPATMSLLALGGLPMLLGRKKR